MKLKKVLFAGLAAALAVSGIGKAGAWEEVGIFQLMECSKGEHCAIYRFPICWQMNVSTITT